jgi:uncharacterized protein YbjT (DUF2867 family)
MADAFTYLVGATRGTGLEVARILSNEGLPVVALARSSADIEELESTGAKIACGDVLDISSIESSIDGANVIISTLGGKRGEPRPDFDGTRNLVDAARASGVHRFILVSAAGIGESYSSISEQAHQFLDLVLEIKAKAENYLIDSGLDYTIIRPGALDSEPASGNGMLTEDPTIGGTIHRADLARLVVDCLDDPDSSRKIFNAVDRELIGVASL